MNDFWNLSDGTQAETSDEYEAPQGGGVIPDNTNVVALIDEAKWETRQTDSKEYLSVRYNVLEPADFAGRKVFQKLWLTDDDPNAKNPNKKRDNAKRMLMALYGITGATPPSGKPTDEELMTNLSNKPLWAKVMVWSMDDRDNPGEKIEGNWIAHVAKVEGKEVSSGQAPAPASANGAGLDDEIPF